MKKEKKRDPVEQLCKKYGISIEEEMTVDEDDVEGEWSDVK